MVVAPGIKNPGHARFGGEEVGDGAGVAALALDAQVEGFQPLQQHPGVERAEAWAGVAEEALQPVFRELLGAEDRAAEAARSEEHTSELQSLMRISYAVLCLQKKTKTK